MGTDYFVPLLIQCSVLWCCSAVCNTTATTPSPYLLSTPPRDQKEARTRKRGGNKCFTFKIAEPNEIVLYALADKGEVGYFLPDTEENTGNAIHTWYQSSSAGVAQWLNPNIGLKY